ncbi:hypothetical protein [Maribellus sediminis]|uniref:hypothetical protein n=1 Tax=Maribellus sediminis TaxID=2696285 RepID=UPI001431FDF6|nr:hypothetical protein [Maribellus sediminis]
MKNFLFTLFAAFLISFSHFSLAQIVSPDNEDVCYGEEYNYTIDSNYYEYGNIDLILNGGVFIVP